MKAMSIDKRHVSLPIHNLLALVLYFAVNTLFILKYAARSIDVYYIIPVIYLFCVVLIYCLSRIIIKSHRRAINYLLIGLFSFSTIIMLVLHHKIDPLALNIDRWSAIHNFIEHLFLGIYPYSAHTHLGGYGSPFPVWQIFHIPFYLLGNVGLAALFSFVLLTLVLLKVTKDKTSSFYYILLLVLSPAFWYEIAVLSDLLYNLMLVFVVVLVWHYKKITLQSHALAIGIICGLFLSTRLAVVVPFFIFLFSDFIRLEFKKKVLFISALVLTFVASFIPLMLWDYHLLFFFEYNPFVLQSRQGNSMDTIFLIAISLYFALAWKGDFVAYNRYTGYAIIAFIAFTFALRMIANDFVFGLFSPFYDISYFSMSLPFIIYSLAFGCSFEEKAKLPK